MNANERQVAGTHYRAVNGYVRKTFWITNGFDNRRIAPHMVVPAGWRRGRTVPKKYDTRLRRDWRNQKMDAKRRGVSFLLSYDDWLRIWRESGHLEERGCRCGEYVMARFNDTGPYSTTNVRIAQVEENHAEAWARPEQRAAYAERARKGLSGRQSRIQHYGG